MNVLVNGIGNIGQTLLNLLVQYKDLLNIEKIYALKNTNVKDWNKIELDILQEQGIILCSRDNSSYIKLDNIISSIDYIFDCNANTYGLRNKSWYENIPNLIGASAQGSEKDFGISFMTGINNDVIKCKKYVHIVSCNTHSISSIIETFTNSEYGNLIEGDFVVVRRSEDIGNKERLVGANVISRHLDGSIGTHHAIDVKDLFKTKNIKLNIQSSDITTPSQLMHTVRFNLEFESLPNTEIINNRIEQNKSISTTSKFDSNIVFELGRRYSHYGRLYSHCILNNNNLLWDIKKNKVKGWAFIPQEGNTLLSTIHAFLLQTGNNKHQKIIDTIISDLIRKEW